MERRGRFVAALIAALLAAPGVASAQGDYPNRTIRIIVPAPPGPMLDTLPRLIGAKLTERWGQPVVVENRPGAAQTLGAEAVAKAPPDGYTILFTPPGPLVVTPHLSKLNYDAAAFTPITVMVKVPAVFVANPKLPAATFAEFIAYAKANPDKITYGSPGAGSTPQLATERLTAAAGIRLIHVPYQGLAPAMRDLLAGHIDVLIDNLGNVVPHLPDRSLKVLAATTETRLPEVPDVPAANELLPGFSHADWFGFVAPPRTPPEIAAKLSQAIAETLKQPDVALRLRDFYVTPVGNSPAEMGAQLKQESERWRQVIGATAAKPN